MPLMGLLGGVGQGLADTGQMMQKDALEARRQQRLEEVQMRREERANAEWYNRDAHTFKQTYGAEADPSEGTRNIDNRIEFATKYGAEADKGLGAGHYENELAVNRTRGTEQAKNAANQFSGLLTDPTVGAHQRGPDGRIHSVGAGAGGAGKAGDPAAKTASATELNHARSVLETYFGGKLDEMGRMFLPPDAKEKYSAAYGVVVDLINQGADLGTAVSKALQSVGHQVSEEEAQRLAEEEARGESFGFLGGGKRDEWVSNRQREIMEQRRMESQEMLGRAPGANQHAATLQQAEQAIAQGANPDAVRERLIELGVPENQINF